MTPKPKRKVLLIGWDAADWKMIHPLMDSGRMPALKSMVDNGVMGNMATIEPPFSPMLWTSIATGMLPDKHGILGFTEPDPNTGNVRPVSCTSRKVKAIWNILTQNRMRTHVVGWWPSHPAEPINGICISNHYQRVRAPLTKPWPMLPGTVHPDKMQDLFAWLRIHPAELTQAHLLPVIPEAGKVDQEKDKRLSSYAKILAECSTIHSAATWILENESWDFMAIYYDAIDHFSHGFMRFHPPKMPGVPDELFDIYKGVVSGGYRYHDMMLARLLELAGPQTTVILISDHGFHSDHLRPHRVPKEPAGPAYQHRPQGVICMKGPGIKQDELIYGASLLDITPTILSLFGLPVGEDMDGKALIQACEQDVELTSIPSWEEVPGNSGMHPPHLVEDPFVAREATQQLVALGYIEDPGEDAEKAVERTKREARYNLARVYIGSGRHEQALLILKALYEENPAESRFVMRYARCCFVLNRLIECKRIVEQFEQHRKKELRAENTLKKIRAKKKKSTAEQIKLDEKTQRIRQARSDLISLRMLKADILLKENHPKKALAAYKRIDKQNPGQRRLSIQIANSYFQLNQYQDAENAFKKAIDIDPDSPEPHFGLAKCLVKTGKYEDAIDAALISLGLNYNLPFAHYHLGEALFMTGDYEKAAQAFSVCLAIDPDIGKARNYLIKIYKEHLGRPEQAAIHRQYIKNREKPAIVVVSGLPRSGTSMMMQMLQAGGKDLFIDDVRKPDESNIMGYYEHEAVKRIARDKSWVKDAQGMAVKVVSQLLFHLPAKYNYKIIFMQRDIREVIASQQKLLEQSGKENRAASFEALETSFRNNFSRVEKWVNNNHNVDMRYINFSSVIEDPFLQAETVCEFLGETLKTDKMAAVVNKKLYRTRH